MHCTYVTDVLNITRSGTALYLPINHCHAIQSMFFAVKKESQQVGGNINVFHSWNAE